MPKYKGDAYLRLSCSANRSVESDSIANQKKLIEDFVAVHLDIELVSERVDDGYSGVLFEWPAVQGLPDQVRDGKINCIIVKDFTQFGRNSIEAGYFMEMVFPLYGIRFISINDDFDSDKLHGDTGGINVVFKYLISEFYSRALSIKYKSAKYIKFKRGEYQRRNCLYGHRKATDGHLEPDEETAPNVRLIFELARDGLKVNQIIEELFKRGIQTLDKHKATNKKAFSSLRPSTSHTAWAVSILTISPRIANPTLVGARPVSAAIFARLTFFPFKTAARSIFAFVLLTGCFSPRLHSLAHGHGGRGCCRKSVCRTYGVAPGC